MTFRNWLKRYAQDDTPRGDLARDMQDDTCAPRKGDLLTFEAHLLVTHEACHEAMETLREAWADYRNSARR